MENTIVNQNAAAEQPSVLDLLLGEKVINVAKNLPTAKFEVPRLSEAAGAPVIFTLQALPYGRVQDIAVSIRTPSFRSCWQAASTPT